MRVKNTLYQHQNFSAAAFNRAPCKKPHIDGLAGTTRGGGDSTVASYYEVPRVVAIE